MDQPGPAVPVNVNFKPQGDRAIRVAWPMPASAASGTSLDTPPDSVLAQARAFAHALDQAALPAVEESVPAYATVTVFYRPQDIRYADLCTALQQLATQAAQAPAIPPRTVEIPVRYGGDHGPDLMFVAEQAKLTCDDVIALHTEPTYTVAMIGFMPGFPYLTGLPGKLHVPRLDRPRVNVPAGSIAIGGSQTGVYPFGSPGGWRLIGRTPLKMFDPARTVPSLCTAGDLVRFRAISEEDYRALLK